MTLRDMTPDERRQKAEHALRILEELDPYFMALERREYEALLTIKSGPWWRGDQKRREHIDRINTIRGVKGILDSIVRQGTIVEKPKRGLA